MKPTVLIVDDEKPVLKSIRRLLFADDYNILLANSGEEALELFIDEKNDIDTIVSDQHMPNMQGVELFEEIQKIDKNCSRILLSGHIDIELLRNAVNNGEVYRFVAKPWEDDELRMAIRHGCERTKLLTKNVVLNQRYQKQNEELKKFNDDLSSMVSQRTQSLEVHNNALQLSHEVLDNLPFIVLGIDPSGIIAMANTMAINTIPNIIPGTHYTETLPKEFQKHIEEKADKQSIVYKNQTIILETTDMAERGVLISGFAMPISPDLPA